MKKALLTKLMLLLCALIAGSSSVWATTITKTMSEIVSANSYTISAGSDVTCYTSFALDANITISTTGSANCGSFWGTSPNIDWRLYQNKSGDITITAATGYALQSITITYSAANSGILQDGSTTISSGAAQSVSGTSKTYTVSKTGSGTNGQVKVTQISVTYQNPSDTRTETTVTIAGNETERYMDQSATTPSATVKAGDTPIDGASVTWSSTETGVATISSTGAITLVAPGTTTIKAQYAGNATYKPSESSYTLNVYGVFTTMAQLQAGCAAYGNTAMKGKMTFNNVYVTAVKGNNAYISDGTNGAVIFKSSHGFVAGDKLASTALEMTMMNYNGYTPEITSLTKTTDGLTVTSGNEITPTSLAVNAITTANFGTLVKITNVTYDASKSVFKDASSNEIAYYDNFSAGPTLNDGEEYDVTGVILFKNSTTVEICPRAAADVVPKVVKTNPTSQWKNGEAALSSITINKAEGTKKYTFETDSDGGVTYESSKTTVATIASDGTITPVGYGTTTITANVAVTENYFADSKSFVLTIVDNGVDLLTADLIGKSSYTDWSGLISNTDAVYAGNSAKGYEAIQMRKSTGTTDPSGIVTTTSAGKVNKISVVWNSNTANGRTIVIYGKNTPYTGAADLYDDNTKGTQLGTIAKGSTDLTITGNYGYIGIVSSDGALYLDQIVVSWDEDVVPMSVSDATWASFSSAKALDFTGTGVTAYIAKEKDASNVTLSEIAKVPASTGIVVNAPAGTYAIPVLSGAADVTTGNLLQPWLTAGTPTAGTYYTLAVSGTDPIFKKSSGGTLAAGKAYLDLSGTSAPVLNVSFENSDVTGVKDVRSKMEDVRGEVYDLQGRKVAQPTKGLYIQNGRKVILK